jgi:outer membrane receptor protein involved in Fe transport
MNPWAVNSSVLANSMQFVHYAFSRRRFIVRFSLLLPIVILVNLVGGLSASSANTALMEGYSSFGLNASQIKSLELATTNAMVAARFVNKIIILSSQSICGTNTICHCQQARDRDASYALFGSASVLADTWRIEFNLLETHACRITNTQLIDESFADSELATRVQTAIALLLTPLSAIDATANKSERFIDDVPAMVSGFSSDQISDLHIRRMEDLLPLLPGVEAPEANWGAVVLNQGQSNTMLVVADGVPLLNGLTSFRSLDRDFRSSMSHLDKIEFARGPGSVLWGQNAFLGVLNLLTEVGDRQEPELSAGLHASSLRSTEAWARAKQRRGDFAFSISLNGGRRFGATTNVKDSPYTTIGVPRSMIPWGNAGETELAADTWFDANVKLRFKQWMLAITSQSNDTSFEISPQGPLLDPGAGGWWRKEHRIYQVHWNQTIDTLTLSAQASRYELTSNENFAIAPVYPGANEQSATVLRDGFRSLQGNPKPRMSHALELKLLQVLGTQFQNRLLVGISLTQLNTPDSLATTTGIATDPTATTTSFGRKSFSTIAGFVSNELRPIAQLRLTAGARPQWERRSGGVNVTSLSTHAAAVLKFQSAGGKLVYSEGFRAPDAVQLYSTVGTEGNSALRPEKSREIALYAHFDPHPILRIGAGFNHTRIRDLVSIEPLNDPNKPQFGQRAINKGNAAFSSAYVETALNISQWITSNAHYHLTVYESKNQTRQRATHSGAVAFVLRPLRDLSTFVRASVASPRDVTLITADGVKDIETKVTIHTALGLTISSVVPGVDFDLDVTNPFGYRNQVPYRLDGAETFLLESRRDTEVFASVRYRQ